MVNRNNGCVIPFDVIHPLIFRVGIIGDPKNLYSADKLMPVGGENEDEENEEDNAKRYFYFICLSQLLKYFCFSTLPQPNSNEILFNKLCL